MKNINWKQVSKSRGYISLKNEYIKDVQKANMQKRPMRGKDEFRRHFKKAIAIAQKCSDATGESLQGILIYFEQDRSGWWLNYYQDWLYCAFIKKYNRGIIKCL
jgi:hypothetical protein